MRGIPEEVPLHLGTSVSREDFLEEMSELRPKVPIGISQEEEEEQAIQEEGTACARAQPYPHGLPVQWGKQTHPQRVGSPEKMSDLAWVIAKTIGMCRKEHKSILGKENSPFSWMQEVMVLLRK